MAINAHNAFNIDRNDSFAKKIKVSEIEKNILRSARDEIRNFISEGLKSTLNNHDILSFSQNKFYIDQIKFKMQGSFSYHTLVQPSSSPPQEIDLDDGIFLPASFFSISGVAQPKVASNTYFTIIETILERLCENKNWILVKKDSCLRVQINKTKHCDLALYVVNNDDYVSLNETSDLIEFSEQAYYNLQLDSIMLAHRTEGWVKSNPRKLEDWFRDAIVRHGDQIRHVSKYLKAWKDYTWTQSSLSSIALMYAVVETFDQHPTPIPPSRHDLSLLEVSKKLAGILGEEIPNPVVYGERLDQNWSDADRKDYIDQAQKLNMTLVEALVYSPSRQQTRDKLKKILGPRMPDDETLYGLDDSPKKILTAGIINRYNEDPEVNEAVNKEGDGRFG